MARSQRVPLETAVPPFWKGEPPDSSTGVSEEGPFSTRKDPF